MAKKTTSKKTKKKTTAGKSTVKKKAAAKRGASKKKTTKKAPVRKKTTKKAPAKSNKKTTKQKSTSGNTVKKKPVAAASKQFPAEATATTKKKTRKSAPKRKTTSKDGRSVAAAAAGAVADKDGYVLINGRRVRMISKKEPTAPTRKTKTSTAERLESAPLEKAKVIKTKLTAKELRGFRELLLGKRAELVGDLSAMEKEALQSTGGNLSNMPIHMADIGTDTYDQDFMLNLAENERQRIREIDDALKRIEDKTYGVCLATGKQIPKARLNAKPWARYTIEAARRLEQGMNA